MSYSALVRDFVSKAQDTDELLSGLLTDLVELKRSVPPEKEAEVAKAISALSTSQQQLITARDGVEAVLQSKESIDEGAIDLAAVLITHGYSRNVAAPADEVWYAHPKGHQVRAKSMPGQAGLCWEHFPPDLRTINRGFGMDRLREHLQLAHRDQKPQQTEGINDAKERSPEGRDALNTDYRDFLVVQTDEAPVERFLVREAAHDYPHIIGHFPKTGEWRDYTIEASGYPEDDRYIQVVKRWKYLGRPVLKRASDVPGAGETKGSPGYVSQTMADGGHERPPRGSSNAPVGLPDRTPRL